MSYVVRHSVCCALWWFTAAAVLAEDAPPTGAGTSNASDPFDPSPFERAVARVSSPAYAYQRWQPARRLTIADQQALLPLMAWRSGLVAPGAPFSRLGSVPFGPRWWPGSQDLYSPYYLGPFEPTPFWPGHILGYPYLNAIEQPIGHRITPKDGDIADGYVYEPVYAQTRPIPSAVGAAPTFELVEPRPLANPPGGGAGLALARAALARADYAAVLAEIERLPQPEQDAGDVWLFRSLAQMALGDYRAASHALHRALVRVPERHWAAAIDDAAVVLPAGEYGRLIAALAQASQLRPRDPEPWFLLGFHEGFQGSINQAIIDLREALDLGVRFRDDEPGQDPIAVRLLNRFVAEQSPTATTGPREF